MTATPAKFFSPRTLWVGAGVMGLAGWACSMTVGRDLTAAGPQQALLDDLCGLQAYHDEVAARRVLPPQIVSSREFESTEGKMIAGGSARFVFNRDDQLKVLRRLLEENFKRVPPDVMTAPELSIELLWAFKAGTRRMVTDHDAELKVGDRAFTLPFHLCLNDLFFGDALYATRREMLGLPAIVVASDAGALAGSSTLSGDAGASAAQPGDAHE